MFGKCVDPSWRGDNRCFQNVINPSILMALYLIRLEPSLALLWESQISEAMFLPCLHALTDGYCGRKSLYILFDIIGVCLMCFNERISLFGGTCEGGGQSLWNTENGCIWMWSKWTHEDMGHIWCLVELYAAYWKIDSYLNFKSCILMFML